MGASVKTLEDFARAILFGERLEDKLAPLPGIALDGAPPPEALVAPPVFPGRSERLARIGKAEFPKLDRLAQDPTTRGQILHFFANHELMALELMALMLLRFPEAPAPFRAGIARTMAEEQEHLKLYIARMQELGVGFGDLPLSDYFWNAMKDMSSPLEFTVQMSLTLEQANLDYSLYYQKAVAQAGDGKTAEILERVYREEIGHVRHGVNWFNRWRDPRLDDWDAYLRLLPSPMTPRRAKGLGFSADSRRQAGLSERFIRELEIFGGSRGRPPEIWLYNPFCEAEIARGKPGFSPSEPARKLSLELESLIQFLAADQDVVLMHDPPRAEWLKELRAAGFEVPEFRRLGRPGDLPREPKIGGLRPWGWSPEPFERFRGWHDRLTPSPGGNSAWAAQLLSQESFAASGLGQLSSKRWSSIFLREWLEKNPADSEYFGSTADLARNFDSLDKIQSQVKHAFSRGHAPLGLLAKAPLGTSGNQNRRILDPKELEGPILGWLRGTIDTQGSVLLEPLLDKLADLSLQIDVGADAVKLLGVRRFYVGKQMEFRGTDLDPRLSSLGPEILRFLNGGALDRWQQFARVLGERLREAGYQGPAGLDALVFRENRGKLRLRPLVELNPRFTMGRVALALERRVLPGTPARWVWAFARDLDLGTRGEQGQTLGAWSRALAAAHPFRQTASGGGFRISEGIVLTSDPERCREVMPILAVGEAAIAGATCLSDKM